MPALGIDFGTSNTAAGFNQGGSPKLVPLEDGHDTLPTAVFLDFHARKTLYGRGAIQSMIDGQEGRFMRALKSILGTPLAREKRQFMNERLTLIEVIARFLSEIKKRSEQQSGLQFERAISGRPVKFHSASEARNEQALVDLTDAYHLAEFSDVSFLPEPEAAAIAAKGTGRILIVDIGGGTSDFTICERKNDKTQIIVSDGIRLGGTNFDKDINLSHVMPLLGYEAEIGNEMGSGSHSAPRALFQDLASWEKIAFVYNPQLLRDVRRWERLAHDPQLFARLGEVLDMHLGHDIAFAVEAGKIAANGSDRADIDLAVVETGLTSSLQRDAMQAELQYGAEAIAKCALETTAQANLKPDQIDRVVFVGGSSLLGVVQKEIANSFPTAALETSEVFTAVVDGLALSTA